MSSTVKTTWFSSAATPIVSAPPADAIRPSSCSVRAGTFASSDPLSSESSLVSFTPSRYESVATMRSSLPLAVTRTPVRCGRVSSREAARATRAIVSTNAAAGTVMLPSAGGSGSFGKSSVGSVRRWNFAGPDITSTSCSALRYSSVRSSFGNERTTSSSSRPGTTAWPGRSPWSPAPHGRRAPCRWPGARPCRRPRGGARRRVTERDHAWRRRARRRPDERGTFHGKR